MREKKEIARVKRRGKKREGKGRGEKREKEKRERRNGIKVNSRQDRNEMR